MIEELFGTGTNTPTPSVGGGPIEDFPAAFISGGNGDNLTIPQSHALAGRLTELCVPVTAVFYPDDHSPALLHEHQFVLDEAGLANFADQAEFLAGVSA